MVGQIPPRDLNKWPQPPLLPSPKIWLPCQAGRWLLGIREGLPIRVCVFKAIALQTRWLMSYKERVGKGPARPRAVYLGNSQQDSFTVLSLTTAQRGGQAPLKHLAC